MSEKNDVIDSAKWVRKMMLCVVAGLMCKNLKAFNFFCFHDK